MDVLTLGAEVTNLVSSVIVITQLCLVVAVSRSTTNLAVAVSIPTALAKLAFTRLFVHLTPFGFSELASIIGFLGVHGF